MAITPSTTLAELHVQLSAFGLAARVSSTDSSGTVEASLTDPDGYFGRARGASLSEALAVAYDRFVDMKSRAMAIRATPPDVGVSKGGAQ